MRTGGGWLVVASTAFWLSWALMPGVGVTDTATIFALVGEHRASVLASVVLQLVSAAAYAPAIIGMSSSWPRGARAGGVLLLIGAMGSAADAIFHLVAYEMTAPSVASDAMAPIMRRLQGPDLALLLPFVAAFVMGHALLVRAYRERARLARFAARLLLAAPAIVLGGAPLAHAGVVAGRLVGLAVLATISGSAVVLGVSIAASPRSEGAFGAQRRAERRRAQTSPGERI